MQETGGYIAADPQLSESPPPYDWIQPTQPDDTEPSSITYAEIQPIPKPASTNSNAAGNIYEDLDDPLDYTTIEPAQRSDIVADRPAITAPPPPQPGPNDLYAQVHKPKR